MPRSLSHLLYHSHATPSPTENLILSGGQIAHLEAKIATKNDGHRNFLTKCAGWENGKVSLELTPQLWSKIRSMNSTDIEQSFTDATLLTGRHSSAAANTVEMLAESDSVGDLTQADLVRIANQQKASREFIRSYEEPTCSSIRGISESTRHEYAKISNECDFEKDYAVYKESQMFREHIVKIANLSDPVKRNAAFKKELDSRSSCRAEIVIALYRLR